MYTNVFNVFVHFFEDRTWVCKRISDASNSKMSHMTKVKIPLDHLPPLLPTCYEIILDRNGILWVCKRISDASNSKMSHDVIYDPSVVGSRLDLYILH